MSQSKFSLQEHMQGVQEEIQQDTQKYYEISQEKQRTDPMIQTRMNTEENILRSLQYKDIEEFKSMRNPVPDIKIILEFIMLAFEKSTDWKNINHCINEPSFIDSLNQCQPENMKRTIIQKIKRKINENSSQHNEQGVSKTTSEAKQLEYLSKISNGILRLYKWINALVRYCELLHSRQDTELNLVRIQNKIQANQQRFQQLMANQIQGSQNDLFYSPLQQNQQIYSSHPNIENNQQPKRLTRKSFRKSQIKINDLFQKQTETTQSVKMSELVFPISKDTLFIEMNNFLDEVNMQMHQNKEVCLDQIHHVFSQKHTQTESKNNNNISYYFPNMAEAKETPQKAKGKPGFGLDKILETPMGLELSESSLASDQENKNEVYNLNEDKSFDYQQFMQSKTTKSPRQTFNAQPYQPKQTKKQNDQPPQQLKKKAPRVQVAFESRTNTSTELPNQFQTARFPPGKQFANEKDNTQNNKPKIPGYTLNLQSVHSVGEDNKVQQYNTTRNQPSKQLNKPKQVKNFIDKNIKQSQFISKKQTPKKVEPFLSNEVTPDKKTMRKSVLKPSVKKPVKSIVKDNSSNELQDNIFSQKYLIEAEDEEVQRQQQMNMKDDPDEEDIIQEFKDVVDADNIQLSPTLTPTKKNSGTTTPIKKQSKTTGLLPKKQYYQKVK